MRWITAVLFVFLIFTFAAAEAQYRPYRRPAPVQEECPQGRQIRAQKPYPASMTDCQVLDVDMAAENRRQQSKAQMPSDRSPVSQRTPPPKREAASQPAYGAADVYRSRYRWAGFLLRASSVCDGDSKREIEAGFRLLSTEEFKAVSKAYPDTTGIWLVEGGESFNKQVMKNGILQTCAFAASVRQQAEDVAKQDSSAPEVSTPEISRSPAPPLLVSEPPSTESNPSIRTVAAPIYTNNLKDPTGQNGGGWIWAVLLAALGLYFTPALIAANRSHHNTLAISALNLFLGWSFLGWVIAFVWACTRTEARESMAHGDVLAVRREPHI
jgi:Superinfection immunity protein